MPVHSTHRTYDAARTQWDRCRDCHSGTDAVKKKGTAYLPMLEGQAMTTHEGYKTMGYSNTAYEGYKNRALFYPAMARTVLGLAGLTFAKPPTVENVPEVHQESLKSVTLTNESIHAFAMQVCYENLITGRVGILTDMPMPNGGTSDANPYFVLYPAENIINWRTTQINDQQILTMVVLQEEIEVVPEDDPFYAQTSVQYRVLELKDNVYTVTLYNEKSSEKGKWEAADPITPQRRGAPLTRIPFVFVSPTGMDVEIQHPALIDLVDVNLSHYRTSADQEHGAHFTALPTPYVTGHTLPPNTTLGIGSGQAWVFPNPSASCGMVEFSGAGLASLAALKEEKRLLMATLGARMLETQKKGQEAAETVRLRQAGEQSALLVMAQAISYAMTAALWWYLWWSGLDEELTTEVSYQLNPDAMEQLSAQDLTALVATWQAGAISHKTLYYNMAWGEWTRPEVTFDEEKEEIDNEAANEPEVNLPVIVPAPPQQIPPSVPPPESEPPKAPE